MFIKFGDKTKNIIVKKACPSRAYKKGTPNSCSCDPPCGLEDSKENTIYLDDSDDEKKEDRRLKILKEYDNK